MVLYILYSVLYFEYGTCEPDDDSIEDADKDDVVDDLDEEVACMAGVSGVAVLLLFL